MWDSQYTPHVQARHLECEVCRIGHLYEQPNTGNPRTCFDTILNMGLGLTHPKRWMYPFERYLKHLKKKINNKARVVASIHNSYLVEEATRFYSYYFEPHPPKLEIYQEIMRVINLKYEARFCQFATYKEGRTEESIQKVLGPFIEDHKMIRELNERLLVKAASLTNEVKELKGLNSSDGTNFSVGYLETNPGTSVSAHVLKMKGYFDQLEKLGAPSPQTFSSRLCFGHEQEPLDKEFLAYKLQRPASYSTLLFPFHPSLVLQPITSSPSTLSNGELVAMMSFSTNSSTLDFSGGGVVAGGLYSKG
ncbi:hypothetical protein M9H77_03107 [Catharanthus roseus]|uniref:Uncharacterized protein n=1 Tax=Catharanthus roseus TaxID=4058 RepID=A0ACC0CAG8_CATRO|nr:hypothetical protein M9H77_03107 [Catharanthus roseus]